MQREISQALSLWRGLPALCRLSVVILLGGCSGTVSNGGEAGGPDGAAVSDAGVPSDSGSVKDLGLDFAAAPLANCLPGWYLIPPPTKCLTACFNADPNPECQHGDCQQLSFGGFLPDGSHYGGALSISRDAGTISSVGSVPVDRYVLVDGGYELLPSQFFEQVERCTATDLISNHVTNTRADAPLSRALSAATADGGTSWRGVPLLP